MITRITGGFAVFVFSLALGALLLFAIDIYDDGLSELGPPSFTAKLFPFAPISWLLLVNPLLLGAWYWFLSAERPPPRRAIVAHLMVCALAAILVALGMGFKLQFMHMDGSVPPTPARWLVNLLITGSLVFAVWWEWRRQRQRRH